MANYRRSNVWDTANSSLARVATNMVRDIVNELEAFKDNATLTSSAIDAVSVPCYEVRSYTDRYEVDVELAGLEYKDVSVEITDDNCLSITCNRECEHTYQHEIQYSNRQYGKYALNIELQKAIHPENVSASMTNGLLRVIVPLQREKRNVHKVVVEKRNQ